MRSQAPVSDADLQRFSEVATIRDKQGFLTVLEQLLAERAANGPSSIELPADVIARARAFEAPVRYQPSGEELQRGHMLQVAEFRRKSNVPIGLYTKLVGKARQQLYREVASRKLLALSIEGRRGMRVPDWQLQAAPRALTQAVLTNATHVDAWTVYQYLSTPDDGVGGRTPVEAVTSANIAQIADMVCARLGVFG